MATSLVEEGVIFPDSSVQGIAFPSSGILMWYGDINNIPPGWFLCNGSNGTPDLRNRFVVGAGDSYAVGATGGSNSVTLTLPQVPTHNHDVVSSGESSTSGSHSHTPSVSTVSNHSHSYSHTLLRLASGTSFGAGTGRVDSGGIDAAGGHNHSAPNTNTTGSHTHGSALSVANVGSGQSHENRPPFMALVFIMKN